MTKLCSFYSSLGLLVFYIPFTPGIKRRFVSGCVIWIIWSSFAFTPGILNAFLLSSCWSGLCPLLSTWNDTICGALSWVYANAKWTFPTAAVFAFHWQNINRLILNRASQRKYNVCLASWLLLIIKNVFRKTRVIFQHLLTPDQFQMSGSIFILTVKVTEQEGAVQWRAASGR